MYTNLILATSANVTARNDALRQYARWEYGRGDVGWLLGSASRRRREPAGKGGALRMWFRALTGTVPTKGRADAEL
ncbi:MAG: hypothetical protein HY557_07770 [Euryarchaeota archaeon]|nr:hypothetical protein [Euryarchaeota archaeon]